MAYGRPILHIPYSNMDEQPPQTGMEQMTITYLLLVLLVIDIGYGACVLQCSRHETNLSHCMMALPGTA